MTTITTFEEACRAVQAGADPLTVARQLVAGVTPSERLWCLDGDMPALAGVGFLADHGYHRAPFRAAEVPRIGFPGIVFSDGPRGAVIGNGTCFPVSMARGATWNPELEERVGQAIGAEIRATGANITGAVCVNVLRHPAWGRAQETYGEDPHHVGEMGAAFTRGLQQYVMACVKHFACNSMENARFTVDVQIDDVALHEIYLPQFRRIVDEGAAAVMSAYNSVNGQWCGQSQQLLTDVLRGEWGFAGITISDFVFGVRDAVASVEAGLDIEMPLRMVRYQHLAPALEAGETSWENVDTSVERLIATLLRFDDILSKPAPPLEIIGSAEHRSLARQVAAESVVLLRNESVDGGPALPFSAEIGRVAVIGRLADAVNVGDMGSSDVWDLECVTVLDGLRNVLPEVDYDDGLDVERATSVASAAEACVVVVGYTHIDEGEFIGQGVADIGRLFPPEDEPEVAELFERSIAELPPAIPPSRVSGHAGGFGVGGDRRSLHLAAADVELIRAVAAANPRTVVVIQSGSATVISEWIEAVPAVVQAWYGGWAAGSALADVLLGSVNPSGRMPMSVPVDEGDLPPFEIDATAFRVLRLH